MSKEYIWSVIFIIAITSYLPRAVPLVLLKHFPIPAWFKKWLTFVPTAIFGALVLPDILLVSNSLDFSLNNIPLWTTVIIAPLSLKTKSLGNSVVAGAIIFTLLQYLQG